MRAALAESLARPAVSAEGYVAGSIVICLSCARPLYRLERGVAVGETPSRAIDAFRPVRVSDLDALRDRPDVDAGVRAHIVAAAGHLHAYTESIPLPRMGAKMICPFCEAPWVVGRTAERQDTHDRAFVYELHTIPPRGPHAPFRGAADWWRV